MIKNETLAQIVGLFGAYILLELGFLLVYPELNYLRTIAQGILALGIFFIPFVKEQFRLVHWRAALTVFLTSISIVFLLNDNIIGRRSISSFVIEYGLILFFYFGFYRKKKKVPS